MSEEAKATTDFIRSQMSHGMRAATSTDKVYKDECVCSFDTPYSDNGLYVNLKTFQGFGSDYWKLDYEKNRFGLYLHEVWRQRPIVKSAEEVAAAAPTRLAIEVEGGFMTEKKYETEKTHSLVVVRSADNITELPLPVTDASIPEFVITVCNSIISHDGMKLRLQASTWVDDQTVVESKYARNLIQLPVETAGGKVSNDPKAWKCQESGRTDNLWLNLSTGYIGGGRKNWDGSGGSGAALHHYESTGGLYPLCVKLGTITPHGADVWSYAQDEDALVTDPLLAEHLAHWGIDIMQQEKTDKSLGEMQVELNQSYDWSKILEGEASLTPLSGPGLKGLNNMGATCYMNSVLQALLAVPEVQERYLASHMNVVRSCIAAGTNPSDDFAVQMSKVAHGVLTGRYVPPEGAAETDGDLERYRLTPVTFKNLIGRDHREFSSGGQQDASEYFMHLLQFMQRAERTCLPRLTDGVPQVVNLPGKSTATLFDFALEKRLQCLTSGQVRYVGGAGLRQNTLELLVPGDLVLAAEQKEAELKAKADAIAAAASDATGECAKKQRTGSGNQDAEEEEATIPFEACLENFFCDTTCSIRNPTVSSTANTDAKQSVRMATYPRCLMVKLGRYFVDENWKHRKIGAAIPVPEVLDLSRFKAHGGMQEGEVPIPDEGNATASPAASASASGAAGAIVPDEEVVAQLVSMGFARNGCERAAVATQRDMGVATVEAAMNWVFAHMEDADFNDPLPAQDAGAGEGAGAGPAAAATGGAGGFVADPAAVEMLGAMGFTPEQATAALTATSNSMERAADWLFSHTDNLAAAVQEVMEGAAAAAATANGGGDLSSLVYDTGMDGASPQSQGVYDLFAVVSHMGRSTEHGHYVCHVKKTVNGVPQWVLFNDDKVAQSVRPPLKYGLMYVFKRRD